MSNIYKERFNADYQQFIGYNASERMHKNSKELLQILIDHNIIFDNMKIFEIGAGPGRNLFYIYDYNSTVKLYMNDLYKEASLIHMHSDLRDKIIFYEKDTLSLLKEECFEDIDLLISSDHFMHLEPEHAKEVLEMINNKWKPKYILFREGDEKGHMPKRPQPRYYHDTSILEKTNYDVIFSGRSKTKGYDDKYYIKVWRKKNEYCNNTGTIEINSATK